MHDLNLLYFILFLTPIGYSIITYEFSHNREKYIGLAEAFAGLGTMLGPVIGSILYSNLSYLQTFLALSFLLFANMFLSYFFLPSTLNFIKKEQLLE